MFCSIRDYINWEFFVTFIAGLALMLEGYVLLVVLFSLQQGA